MKTRIIFLTATLFLFLNSRAQNKLFGEVKDQINQPLSGVKIQIENTDLFTRTDQNGSFTFSNLKPTNCILIAQFPGFQDAKLNITPTDFNQKISIVLENNAKSLEEVQVGATRADLLATSTTIVKSTNPIERKNFGQDIPILLESAPSVVTTSDAGAGVGYTGIRIRGVDASRINVTINGIPVNDPESHDVYWVNMPDLASSIENMQIQRGVGSSTNGAAAFGASLNIKSQDISKKAFGSIDNAFGSFNTWKTTIKAGTGLINDKFSLETRLSRIVSDGYIDRATSNLRSYYLAGSYVGEKSVLKAILFSGKEITYQSWYGTPESRIKDDVTEMNAYADRNYLTDEERANLLNSGRTYNYYTYKNQEDNYQQDNFQLHFTHSIKSHLILNVAGHYTYGRGYYEEYKVGQNLSNYGISPVVVGGDTISSTDLIRRRWLDNDFIGTVYSLSYNKSRVELTFGGSANTYLGRHFGEVIWARNASDSELGDRYYDENGQKTEFSNYLKGAYRTSKFLIAGDLQYRHIDYRFIGFDDVSGEIKDVEQQISFDFFNPKVSANYIVNSNHSFFASYGIANREPVRRDFRESSPSSRPKHETMRDLEVGYNFTREKLALSTNLYWMDYTNQLALTGKINDVGGYTRTNVADSYRAGIELNGNYKIIPGLRLNASVSLSQNKIKYFEEFVDEYLDNEPYYQQQVIVHENTDLAFSPNIVANGGFTYVPVKGLTIDWMSKYVGRQFLDNTSNVKRSINPFTFSNLIISYTTTDLFFKEITFGLQVNNLFNAMYSNNGYTFSYIYGGQTTTENFYYPQAGRNFMGRILIKL